MASQPNLELKQTRQFAPKHVLEMGNFFLGTLPFIHMCDYIPTIQIYGAELTRVHICFGQKTFEHFVSQTITILGLCKKSKIQNPWDDFFNPLST